MEGQGKFGEQRPLGEAEVACTTGHQGLDDGVLDLVYAATTEGDDGVVRTLLRTLVALGLASAASYWSTARGPNSATGETSPQTGIQTGTQTWTQRRGFGGATPPPDFERSHHAAVAALSLRLGSNGAVVVLRETFDADGLGEQREDELESLVQLAGTLLQDYGDSPLSHIGETEVEQEPPGPTPRSFPKERKGLGEG